MATKVSTTWWKGQEGQQGHQKQYMKQNIKYYRALLSKQQDFVLLSFAIKAARDSMLDPKDDCLFTSLYIYIYIYIYFF